MTTDGHIQVNIICVGKDVANEAMFRSVVPV